ncbi:L-lactate permease [Tundrisphaera lichenicola]|uniref:L-lactate permease n=1 Tax=Tundrisphaera lichenicola TaxID=2029860 RepID=UPI003EC094B2
MWTQNYDPMGSWPLSTLVAAVPVLVLLGLLASGRASAWGAALAGLLAAIGAAVGVFGMPIGMALAASGHGVVFAAFRIVWLIVAAVFLYDLAVATGQFDVMKASIARLSGDRRIQAVLVAFAFGAFLEGAAGFGAPVAISAAFLVGLGFKPFQAALLCLIANTAPVAWGAIGTPIRTLAGVTGLDVEALSATSGRILPPLSLILPFWLVRSMVPWRETFAVWPVLLAVGGAFAGTQFAWSNFVGYELVDLVSAVASLGAGVIVLKFWRPEEEWRFADDKPVAVDSSGLADVIDAEVGLAKSDVPLTTARVARAWMPFVLLSVTVLLWGVPSIKGEMDARASWKWEIPGLHQQIARGDAVTGHAEPTEKDVEKAVADIVPVSSTGTAVFLAAVISGFLLGVGPLRQAQMLGATVLRLIPAIGAILGMLALGFVTKASGMDVVLGLAFTRTGPALYPIFGTLLGWLGVALTGSDTSSNVLFGNLQRVTAEKLGLSPILMASANTTGGVMGKMIDAQSIVVAAAATGEDGKEGEILRAVIFHSIALALMVGAIVWVYAHLLPGMVAAPMPTLVSP